MVKPVSIEVWNPNGKYRVVSTKPMPGTRWINLLTQQDCRVEICTLKKTILSVEDIIALIGDKCDGVIGQISLLLVFVMAACLFGELSYVKPPAQDVLKGMFIPKLSGQGATSDAIALLGALVMPHNLFLHSTLVLSRKIPNSVRGINDACRYFLMESGFALFVAFLINVAVIYVTGSVCNSPNMSKDNLDRCDDITLNSASFLLKSSTITGTYAGQYIMQGFIDLKMKTWIRNLVTRLF
ncbi:hypothetical protein POM88_000491 [Heracleum sosnowskyi]|uniref:Uncharacterized protein n=1 Tax=Heracleum sosnowskyi TaxID=360622 RepID=A0AAD8JE22_9APIA|nr:hypothetical protein POM88_000491 [Heracleum sosnowskyi]